MATEQFRWATLKKVSNDKGPYKLATFSADGKDDIIAHVLDLSGVQANPEKDSLAFLILPHGDEGRALAIVLPPPAKRTDQQKEGEVSYVNHTTGNVMQHKADGATEIRTKGILHLNP